MKRLLILLSALLLLLVGCSGPATTPVAATEPPATPTEIPPAPTATTGVTGMFDPVKTACLVTDIGNVDDGTYNESAYEGMMQAAEELNLETHVVETAAADEYGGNIQDCLDEGFRVIITVGPFIAEQSLAMAQANPDAHFIAIDQGITEIPDNMVVVHFREDQAGFLAGALACMMTESNVVGGVYGIDFPPLKRFRNGFENGCHYVNPEATTLGVYMDSFTDPLGGADAAAEFIEQGADVIFGAAGPTGSGAIRQAAQDGIWVIGVDQDEYETTFLGGNAPGADKLLSSAVKEVGKGVYDQLKGLADPSSGLWAGGDVYIMETANEGIDYADFHEAEDAIPEAVKERLAEIRAQLASGEIKTGVDPVSGDPLPEEMPEPDPFEE